MEVIEEVVNYVVNRKCNFLRMKNERSDIQVAY